MEMKAQDAAGVEPAYGWVVRLSGRSLGEAREVVTGALKEQGFGILTEIDVRQTFEKKLGRDFRPYVILGACNPTLAHPALEAELAVGLLLPCNVCLWQDGETVVVARARPDAMFRIVDNPALRPIADEAERRLHAAVARIRRAAE
jgi:uncharacterized protein (DUF302 family)